LASNYDELIASLTKDFQANCGVTSSMELYNRKKEKEESIGKFYSSITSLAKRLYPNMEFSARDQIVLGAFIKGLPINYQHKLLNHPDLTTSEQAFQLAQRYERTYEILERNLKTEAVNQVLNQTGGMDQRESELASIKQSLKNLELREKQRSDQDDRIARHRWRENNMKRRPMGQNRFRYNPPARRFGRRPSPMGRYSDNRPNFRPGFRANYSNNWRQDNQPQAWFNNRNNQWQQQRSRSQDTPRRNTFTPTRDRSMERNFVESRPQRQEQQVREPESRRWQQAVQYNNNHEGQEFTTTGRPICQRCERVGHLQYQCPERAISREQGNNNQQKTITRQRSQTVRFEDRPRANVNRARSMERPRNNNSNNGSPVYTVQTEPIEDNANDDQEQEETTAENDCEFDQIDVSQFIDSYFEFFEEPTMEPTSCTEVNTIQLMINASINGQEGDDQSTEIDENMSALRPVERSYNLTQLLEDWWEEEHRASDKDIEQPFSWPEFPEVYATPPELTLDDIMDVLNYDEPDDTQHPWREEFQDQVLIHSHMKAKQIDEVTDTDSHMEKTNKVAGLPHDHARNRGKDNSKSCAKR
jgi:hypothetical protein